MFTFKFITARRNKFAVATIVANDNRRHKTVGFHPQLGATIPIGMNGRRWRSL